MEASGNLEILESGNLGSWESENLGIWESGIHKMKTSNIFRMEARDAQSIDKVPPGRKQNLPHPLLYYFRQFVCGPKKYTCFRMFSQFKLVLSPLGREIDNFLHQRLTQLCTLPQSARSSSTHSHSSMNLRKPTGSHCTRYA